MKVLVIGNNRAILDGSGKVLVVFGVKDNLQKVARRWTGLARYERTTTRLTAYGPRQARAWKVPGTREHGKWSMLRAQCTRALQLLEDAKASTSGSTLFVTAGTPDSWY